MKRGLVVLLALVLMATPLSSAFAQSQTLDKIKEAGVLTIGTRTGSPPFAYINKNNEWVGFTIDLVEQLVIPAISKEVGKPIKLTKKESTPPNRIPLLNGNQVDLIAGTMTDTPERRQSVDFSLTFFLTEEPYGMAMRKGEPKFKQVVDAGLKQGFESGKYFEIYDKWFGPKGELPYPMSPQVKAYLLKQIGK